MKSSQKEAPKHKEHYETRLPIDFINRSPEFNLFAPKGSVTR